MCPHWKRVQAQMEDAVYLRTVQCQCTELPALETSSDIAKEFLSFYTVLGLRGLLKIFF